MCALPGTAQAQSTGASAPGAALRQQLADLAANPQSVDQLVATGRAALAMGDGEAALGFFTRAEQLAGRDARVKAGLAAANARAGRPETALTLFAEAVSLGAPEAELLADRGLAYDMTGQTARAQQDYLASLRHRDDAEVRRRLALSLAISGQREAALRLIEPQIAGGDRAGQRARIMVLALSGDARGATAAASGALPAQAVQSLTPFLARLASLSPGEMAAAANLGRVPAAGGARQTTARVEADPGALAFAGGGATALPARLPVARADANTPRRRPGGVNGNASAPVRIAAERDRATASARDAGRPRGSWNTASSTMATRPPAPAAAATGAPVGFLQPHPHEPLRVSRAALESAELAGAQPDAPRIPPADLGSPVSSPAEPPVQLAAASQPEPEPTSVQSQPAAEEEPVDGAAANLAVWNSGAAPSRVETPAPARTETPARVRATPAAPIRTATPGPAPVTTRPSFSDVAASVSALPNDGAAAPNTTRPATSVPRTNTRPATSAPRTATRRAQTATSPARTTPQPAGRRAQTAAATPAPRATNSRQAHPSRIWVQLDSAASSAGFNAQLTRIRRVAPEVRRQVAHTVSSGGRHRLLVGPFPTDAAARSFVTGLRQKDIPSTAWTSSAGTPVERLPAGR